MLLPSLQTTIRKNITISLVSESHQNEGHNDYKCLIMSFIHYQKEFLFMMLFYYGY